MGLILYYYRTTAGDVFPELHGPGRARSLGVTAFFYTFREHLGEPQKTTLDSSVLVRTEADDRPGGQTKKLTFYRPTRHVLAIFVARETYRRATHRKNKTIKCTRIRLDASRRWDGSGRSLRVCRFALGFFDVIVSPGRAGYNINI